MENNIRASDYAEEAHGIIKELKDSRTGRISVTRTQLRKILSAVNLLGSKRDIYIAKNISASDISEDLRTFLINLKVKIAYSGAREPAVGSFAKKAKLTERVDKILLTKKIKDLNDFMLFTEALVAYHKVEGGKD